MAKNKMSKDPDKPLTDKEQAFVDTYMINGFNAAGAYRDAYSKGCTNGTASANGHKLKNKANVSKAISERLEDRVGNKKEIANKILDKLQEMVFADKEDEIYTAGVSLKAMDLLQKQLALQTQKVDSNTQTTFTINIGDEENESD